MRWLYALVLILRSTPSLLRALCAPLIGASERSDHKGQADGSKQDRRHAFDLLVG